MADCRKYKEMISPYADGELSGNDKMELEAHLEECAACRSLLSLYKSIAGTAADSLAEPPEHLTESVMNKVRMLPMSEAGGRTAASKQKKTQRSVIISFVAAAACLALAFIVSPQLFGFGSSTNMTTAVPMASAAPSVAYDAASEEAALDYGADAAAKSVESAGTGGAVEDGAAGSQLHMGITAATEAPRPAASSAPASIAPGLTATGRDDSADLKEYYAVFSIEGQLPDILKDAVMTDNSDGTFSIEISLETASQLINDGLKAEMGAQDMTKALVIYTPAQ
jgi:hypothetical protein